MNKKAGFTLSLDCEGLWGMADQSSFINQGVLNRGALESAYAYLQSILETYQIRSSLAFVTAFASEKDLLIEQLPLIRELASMVPNWFCNILKAFEHADFNGWDGSKIYKSLAIDGHEMAWHGATHLPLLDTTPCSAVELELKLTEILCKDIGQVPRSVVFPRNQIGHLERLRAFGFRTYRNGRDNNVVSRIMDVLKEFYLFDARVNVKPCFEEGWYVSPSGFFLNWPAGGRAFIPVQVTVARWKSLLRAAVEVGGYVHMWFHPHNLITAPAMKDAFVEIMREVSVLSRAGDLAILTMDDANRHFTKLSPGEDLDI